MGAASGGREIGYRHVAAAIRFIIRGEGTVTIVNGEPAPMRPGDLVLTPSLYWHGHVSEGPGPMMWMDSLDAPLVRITTPHIPLPSAAALEDIAVPTVDRIVETVRRRLDDAK